MYKDKSLFWVKSLFVDERKIKRRTIELRRLFLQWLRSDILKIPDGVRSSKVLILWTLLFPIEALIFRYSKELGYNWSNDTLNLYGCSYSRVLFETIGFVQPGTVVQVIENIQDKKPIRMLRRLTNIEELTQQVSSLKERVSYLEDVLDWCSNGYGHKQLETEYDQEIAVILNEEE